MICFLWIPINAESVCLNSMEEVNGTEWTVKQFQTEVISCKLISERVVLSTNFTIHGIRKLNKVDCLQIFTNKMFLNMPIKLNEENDIPVMKNISHIEKFILKVTTRNVTLTLPEGTFIMPSGSKCNYSSGYCNDLKEVFVWDKSLFPNQTIEFLDTLSICKEFIAGNGTTFLVGVTKTNQIHILTIKHKHNFQGESYYLTDFQNIVLRRVENDQTITESNKSNRNPFRDMLVKDFLNRLCEMENIQIQVSFLWNIGIFSLILGVIFFTYLLFSFFVCCLNSKIAREEKISSFFLSQIFINQLLYNKVKQLSKKMNDENEYTYVTQNMMYKSGETYNPFTRFWQVSS